MLRIPKQKIRTHKKTAIQSRVIISVRILKENLTLKNGISPNSPRTLGLYNPHAPTIIADNLSKVGWSWGCVSAKRFSRSNRLPFVIRTGPRRESAVWPRRRGSEEGEPRSGCSRCQRESLYVRYDDINAMLLNEFLKEHRKGEQLEKQVAALTAALQEGERTARSERVRVANGRG